MTDPYPAPTSADLVERAKSFPPSAKVARWVIRDDNHQHYHGVVSLADSPFLIELRWKPASGGAEQLVGFYRLRLPELLAADFVRFEREAPPATVSDCASTEEQEAWSSFNRAPIVLRLL